MLKKALVHVYYNKICTPYYLKDLKRLNNSRTISSKDDQYLKSLSEFINSKDTIKDFNWKQNRRAKKGAFKNLLNKEIKRNKTQLYFRIMFGLDHEQNDRNFFSIIKQLNQNCKQVDITCIFEEKITVNVFFFYESLANKHILFPEPYRKKYKYKISVCIPTYNRIKILTQCLLALNADYKRLIKNREEFKGKVQVAVIDDGSTDDTSQCLKSIHQYLDYNFDFKTIENSGAAIARNEAAAMADGKIIIYLDDDKIIEKDFLELHWNFHQKHSSQFECCIGRAEWPEYLEINFLMKLIVSEAGGQQFAYWRIAAFDASDLPYDFFITANLSLKKSIIDHFGKFNEELFHDAMWEDIELGWRLCQMGLRIRYNENAVVYHDHPMEFLGFIRRQIRIGQYMKSLSKYSFIPHYEKLEKYISAQKWSADFFRNLDLNLLLNIVQYFSKNEQYFLANYNHAIIRMIYNALITCAMIFGSLNENDRDYPKSSIHKINDKKLEQIIMKRLIIPLITKKSFINLYISNIYPKMINIYGRLLNYKVLNRRVFAWPLICAKVVFMTSIQCIKKTKRSFVIIKQLF